MKFTLLSLVAVLLLVVSASAQNLPGYLPTNGLVGWWPFNGNANDESGNGNNGVVNGATLTSDRNGVLNSAYSFDGNFDYIDCGTSSSLGASTTQPLSISTWFFTQSNGNLLSKYLNLNTPNSNFALICSPPNSKFRITGNGVDYLEDNTVNFGQWVHIVAIFAAGTNNTRIFVNGALTAQGTVTLNTGVAATPFIIGMISGSFPGFFDGFIDDVGVWNRALTQQEVTLLYRSCSNSITGQPVSQSASINTNVQFTTVSSDSAATFQWQNDTGSGFQNLSNAGQYSGATTNTLQISSVNLTNDNESFLCLVTSGGCTDTSGTAILTVNNNVGLNESTDFQKLSVYPNPTRDMITIKADLSRVGRQYSVVDNTGRVVLKGIIKAPVMELSLNDLSEGFYTLVIDLQQRESFQLMR